MKKVGIILVFVSLCSLSLAQTYESTGTENSNDTAKTGVMAPIRAPIDGVYKKVHLSQFKPIGLQYIREADVLYTRLTWSVIDLREKMNHPFYFPTEPRGNWKSLMQTIIDVTTDSTEANPNPIYVYQDEYLTMPLTREGLKENMGNSRTEPILNDWGEQIGEQVLFIPYGSREVFKYIVKDQYIVDKQRSVMEPRTIGICPMFWFESLNTDTYQEESYDDDMPAVTPRRWREFGWLYYNELRPVFTITEVFNPKNNAQRRTYDDVFLMRHFSCYIRGAENEYNNRQVSEYIVNGMDQRLESDKLKNIIREQEHDMWEY